MSDNYTFRDAMRQLTRSPAWSASKVEEIFGAIWLIVAFEAQRGGATWLATFAFLKAALDLAIAMGLAIYECRAERAKKD